MKNRVLPTAIVALVGAIIGSFLMMLYASSHFSTAAAGPGNTPPVVSAAPLTGISDQDRIVSAVKRAKSSVVAINVTVNGRQVVPVDPFIQQFFGGQGPSVMQPYKVGASGSGFVYDGKGDIVTNAHVVGSTLPNAQVSKIEVVFNTDRRSAHIVSENIGADLAVIKVDGYDKLPPALPLADSDRLQQGQWAIAIGEPLELQQSVSLGIVSAFNRTERVPNEVGAQMTFKGLLQTTAPINPGNSGGPLIDVEANVIGVNQLTASGAQGIGFAIPSKTVKQVVEQLIAHPGETTQGTGRAYLGGVFDTVSQGFRQQTGYNGQEGVGVYQVASGSPADQAGLQPGDVVLSLNGKSYGSAADFRKALGGMKPGTQVSLQVWSRGVKKLVSATLGEYPAAVPIQQGP